jgi:hypothetical protein
MCHFTFAIWIHHLWFVAAQAKIWMLLAERIPRSSRRQQTLDCSLERFERYYYPMVFFLPWYSINCSLTTPPSQIVPTVPFSGSGFADDNFWKAIGEWFEIAQVPEKWYRWDDTHELNIGRSNATSKRKNWPEPWLKEFEGFWGR